ncbi:hypothetical protein K523DRAFT_78747 [Schizophyllum commune Tattone D]|nr:hypothetical protein K523DRAFT_78747 [Schizophyllum commune Tattone D]
MDSSIRSVSARPPSAGELRLKTARDEPIQRTMLSSDGAVAHASREEEDVRFLLRASKTKDSRPRS